MGPPCAVTGNLNGLNLSLNHGLDLTCPTYGCLNLTQNNANRQQDHSNSNSNNPSAVLNLTQQNFQSNNQRDKQSRETLEVGLNLSLQNGMDLTRQTYYYDGAAADFNEYQYEHRNSPLNLEHRSSPLNLTHNKFNQNADYHHFTTNFTHNPSTSYSNYYQADHSASAANSQQQDFYYGTQVQQSFSNNEGGYQAEQPHQQQSNAKIRLFCSTCSQEFTTSNELNKHMEKHNMELNCASSSSASIAVQASSSFHNSSTNNRRYNDHLTAAAAMNEQVVTNNSTNKKSFEEPQSNCSECNLTFPTGQDLKKHIDLAHQGRQGGKKYQCAQCAAEFDDVKSHRDHVDAHAYEKPFKCPKCGLHLTNASGLKRHVRRVHDRSGPTFDCQQCSKSFFEKFDLQRHMKVHATPRCEKCGGKNKSKAVHTCKIPESAKDPELQCKICGVFLDNKVKWGFHMWKHTKNPAFIQTKVKT